MQLWLSLDLYATVFIIGFTMTPEIFSLMSGKLEIMDCEQKPLPKPVRRIKDLLHNEQKESLEIHQKMLLDSPLPKSRLNPELRIFIEKPPLEKTVLKRKRSDFLSSPLRRQKRSPSSSSSTFSIDHLLQYQSLNLTGAGEGFSKMNLG